MQKIIGLGFVSILFLSGCAHSSAARSTASASDDAFCSYLPPHETLGPVVRKDSSNAQLCPQVRVGEPCLMPWTEAMKYCQSNALHLPTSRDFACLLPHRGTLTREVSDMPNPVLPGYYLVASRNPDGSSDQFYMNHDGYKRPAGETENHSLWTASIPPDHPGFAHVYFDKWGGGGLDPLYPTGEDHRYTHPNSVECVVPSAK